MLDMRRNVALINNGVNEFLGCEFIHMPTVWTHAQSSHAPTTHGSYDGGRQAWPSRADDSLWQDNLAYGDGHGHDGSEADGAGACSIPPPARFWLLFRSRLVSAVDLLQACSWLPADDLASAEGYLFLGLPGGADPRPRVTCAAARHVRAPPATLANHNHRALEP